MKSLNSKQRSILGIAGVILVIVLMASLTGCSFLTPEPVIVEKEVIVYVDKIVEVEVPVEVIKEVEVIREVEVIKEVKIYIEPALGDVEFCAVMAQAAIPYWGMVGFSSLTGSNTSNFRGAYNTADVYVDSDCYNELVDIVDHYAAEFIANPSQFSAIMDEGTSALVRFINSLGLDKS